MHRYDSIRKTFVALPKAADVSATKSDRDGAEAFAWWRTIRSDMLS